MQPARQSVAAARLREEALRLEAEARRLEEASFSEDEGDEAIRGAATTLVTAASANGDMAPMCSPPAQAPGGGALKRKRSFHSEEFELAAAGDTISIPVPQAMRGRGATVVVKYE